MADTSSDNEVFRYSDKRPWWKHWLVEGLLCLTSIASLIFIVTVLAVYDGKALPKLPAGITLNTLLAFFVTFTKAAFVAPIAEALSQWKWNMLIVDETKGQSTGSSLYSFGALDNASRGLWGSWLVLREFKWRHFVSFVAFMSIISIFTSPITQQTIAYNIRLAPMADGIAQLPITRQYLLPENGTKSIHNEEMTVAVSEGVGSQPRLSIPPVAATCGSSNCTFERYSTLAMCTSVKNITSLLAVSEIKNSSSPMWTGGRYWERAVLEGNGTTAWNATLPNGISFITPLSYALALIPANSTLAFTELADRDSVFNAVGHFFVVYSSAGNVSYPGFNRSQNPDPWSFKAYEILYHVCVKTYETTFSGGKSNTTLVASSSVSAPRPDNEPLISIGCLPEKDLLVQTCNYTTPNRRRTYLVDPENPNNRTADFAIDREIGSMLTIYLYRDLQLTFLYDGIGTNVAVYSNRNFVAVQDAVYEADKNDPAWSVRKLTTYLDNMSAAVTNAFRTSRYSSTLRSGIALADETFVKVQWVWLTFLVGQMALSFVFLGVTVWRTAKMSAPVIKSSAIAAMITAPTEEVVARLGGFRGLEEAEEKAKGVRVKLDLERRRVVLCQDRSSQSLDTLEPDAKPLLRV